MSDATNGARKGINGDVWKWAGVALAGMLIGQFVPLIQGGAASSAEISALSKSVDSNSAAIRDLARSNNELRDRITAEAEKTRGLLEKQLQRHEDLDAHVGAARMLLEHAKVLERLTERMQANEQQGRIP